MKKIVQVTFVALCTVLTLNQAHAGQNQTSKQNTHGEQGRWEGIEFRDLRKYVTDGKLLGKKLAVLVNDARSTNGERVVIGYLYAIEAKNGPARRLENMSVAEREALYKKNPRIRYGMESVVIKRSFTLLLSPTPPFRKFTYDHEVRSQVSSWPDGTSDKLIKLKDANILSIEIDSSSY